MQRSILSALAAAAALLAVAAPAAAQGPDPIHGVWRNPKNTVHVDIRPCAAGACGYVVWASPKAEADARKGGTEKLVGMQLLRNFKHDGNGTWRGKVFVPDLNATFTGSAKLVDSSTLKARGCLFASVACKSQTWTRISGAS